MSVEGLVVVDVGLDLLGEPGDAHFLRVLTQKAGAFYQVLGHVHVTRCAWQEVAIVRIGDVLATVYGHVVDDLRTDLIATDVNVVHSCEQW